MKIELRQGLLKEIEFQDLCRWHKSLASEVFQYAQTVNEPCSRLGHNSLSQDFLLAATVLEVAK